MTASAAIAAGQATLTVPGCNVPHIGLTLLLGLFPLIALAEEFQTPAITAAELDAKRDTPEAYLVIDVREAKEYRKGHIPGAVNIPHTELGDRLDDLQHPNGIVVYCIVGRRTRLAEQTLLDAGIPDIYHIEGGFGAWISGNYFVKKGKKP